MRNKNRKYDKEIGNYRTSTDLGCQKFITAYRPLLSHFLAHLEKNSAFSQ